MKASGRPCADTIADEVDGWDVEGQDFQNVNRALARVRPDAIVLDLVEGNATDEVAGNTSFDEIRRNWFCPVVVYSDHEGRQNFEHTLVEIIPKGADSDVLVVRSLQRFSAVADVIREVHQDFDKRIRDALWDFTPRLSQQAGSTTNLGNDPVLPRAIRRLVAARIDADASGDGALKAWERFVVPALGKHLLAADLLRRREATWNDPEAFRLVLTPSCDLVPQDGSQPRADQILVARCEQITRLGNVAIDPDTPLGKNKKNKLKPILREGIADGLLPIPRFINHVPSMAANLKRLDFVNWEDVEAETGDGRAAPENPQFVRAASTDSPFRELVVWAYLRVTGRPGAPAVDVDGWLDDITSTGNEAG